MVELSQQPQKSPGDLHVVLVAVAVAGSVAVAVAVTGGEETDGPGVVVGSRHPNQPGFLQVVVVDVSVGMVVVSVGAGAAVVVVVVVVES